MRKSSKDGRTPKRPRIESLAIVGSRSVACESNKRKAFDILDDIHRRYGVDSVVSGGAGGPDSWAEEWAARHGIPCWVIYADWDRHGRGAGFIRNVDIINAATRVVAFWDGISRGTEHSINLARKQKKPRKIFRMSPAKKKKPKARKGL